jgi:hypothetical protein
MLLFQIKVLIRLKAERSDFMPDQAGVESTLELPKVASDLPRGLLNPPEQVRVIVEREKAKAPPDFFVDKAWMQMTDELTIQYYFEDSGVELIYRSTPNGPEVLAIGFDEMQALSKDMSLEEQLKLQTWTP